MIYISNRLGQDSNALPDSCKSHLENTSIQIPLQKIPPCTARSWLGASSPPCRWDTPAPSSQSPPSTAPPLFARGSWLEFCKISRGTIFEYKQDKKASNVCSSQMRRLANMLLSHMRRLQGFEPVQKEDKARQGVQTDRGCTLAQPQRALHIVQCTTSDWKSQPAANVPWYLRRHV